jgi:hypothetical protein
MPNHDNRQDEFSDFERREQEVETVEKALLDNWDDFLPRLEEYTTHESEELRRDIYALLWRMGTQSKDPQRRQTIVELLMRRVLGENEFLRDQLLKWLRDFETGDFNEQSNTILGILPWPEDEASSVIRLIGIADLKSKIPELKELAKREGTNSDTATWYAKDEWTALLVLARMGDERSAQIVNDRVRRESEIIVRATILLKDLAYTKQPSAFDTLKIYLNSAERLPQTKETAPGVLEASYAAALFSQYLEDFPMEESDYFGDAEVSQIRAWVNKQTEWRIKK